MGQRLPQAGRTRSTARSNSPGGVRATPKRSSNRPSTNSPSESASAGRSSGKNSAASSRISSSAPRRVTRKKATAASDSSRRRGRRAQDIARLIAVVGSEKEAQAIAARWGKRTPTLHEELQQGASAYRLRRIASTPWVVTKAPKSAPGAGCSDERPPPQKWLRRRSSSVPCYAGRRRTTGTTHSRSDWVLRPRWLRTSWRSNDARSATQVIRSTHFPVQHCPAHTPGRSSGRESVSGRCAACMFVA